MLCRPNRNGSRPSFYIAKRQGDFTDSSTLNLMTPRYPSASTNCTRPSSIPNCAPKSKLHTLRRPSPSRDRCRHQLAPRTVNTQHMRTRRLLDSPAPRARESDKPWADRKTPILHRHRPRFLVSLRRREVIADLLVAKLSRRVRSTRSLWSSLGERKY